MDGEFQYQFKRIIVTDAASGQEVWDVFLPF
jgi:hypothetical protein